MVRSVDVDPYFRRQREERSRVVKKRLGAAGFIGGGVFTVASALVAIHGSHERQKGFDRLDQTFPHHSRAELNRAEETRRNYLKTAETVGAGGEIDRLGEIVDKASVQRVYAIQGEQVLYDKEVNDFGDGYGEIILGVLGIVGGFSVALTGESIFLKNRRPKPTWD